MVMHVEPSVEKQRLCLEPFLGSPQLGALAVALF